MTGEHERYAELAVGHVLGGLDAADAADFRAHLAACRSCRLRVAELREIASDLAAAERDERQHTSVRTAVRRRADLDPQADPRPSRIGVRHVTVAAVVVMLLAGGMAFWNLHLRTVAGTYAQVGEARGEILRELATGVPVAAEFGPGVTGLVTVDGEDVAFSIAGVPALEPHERVVAWLLPPNGEPIRTLVARHDQIDGQTFYGHLDDRGAATLVVTHEAGALEPAPTGTVLLRAQLRGSPVTDDADR